MANRTKTSERDIEDVFCVGAWVDSVTWSNPLEILKGRECGVNGTVDT